MKEGVGPNWCGTLTVENIEQVADLLRRLLKGRQYRFVVTNEVFDFKPKVRINQELEPNKAGDSINVYYDKDEKRFAGFSVHDSYGMWGCSTSLQEERCDCGSKNPHFVFEWNKVTINHYAPSGHRVCWVIIVEDDNKTKRIP